MTTFTGTIAQLLSGGKVDGATILAWAESLQAETDTWTSFSPTWGSSGTLPTIGNGALTGVYMQNGKVFRGLYTIIVGSTTGAGTGNYSLTLPPGISMASGNTWEALGTMFFRDTSGATTYGLDVGTISASSIGAATNSTRWGAASPIAIGTGDTVTLAIQGNCS